MTFSFYLSEGCVKYLIKLGHARWVMTSLSLVVGEKNDETWKHFKQFLCICAKSHM